MARKFFQQAGDENWLEHGGLFIFIYDDEGEEQEPEIERVVLVDPEETDESKQQYTVHTVCMENCTFINGVLSDNAFHPEDAAWFADAGKGENGLGSPNSTSFEGLAKHGGMSVEELAAQFCSDDPLQRAWAWERVGNYHGWGNLDPAPDQLTREEIIERYKDCG